MSSLKMPDINNLLIAGSLTHDPAFRKTANSTSVVNFTISSNRKYRDNSGIWRENICHVGVVAWHKLAETCHDVLKRGSSVLIDGELQSRNWRNDDGTSRSIVEIRARRIQFLDIKTSEESENVRAEEEKADLPEEKVESTDFDFGYQNLKI